MLEGLVVCHEFVSFEVSFQFHNEGHCNEVYTWLPDFHRAKDTSLLEKARIYA